MEFYDDDGYGCGVEGTFQVSNMKCPRCGSYYRRDAYSIFNGNLYMACADCGLYLENLGTKEIFSKPYRMYAFSGLHDKGKDITQFW